VARRHSDGCTSKHQAPVREYLDKISRRVVVAGSSTASGGLLDAQIREQLHLFAIETDALVDLFDNQQCELMRHASIQTTMNVYGRAMKQNVNGRRLDRCGDDIEAKDLVAGDCNTPNVLRLPFCVSLAATA